MQKMHGKRIAAMCVMGIILSFYTVMPIKHNNAHALPGCENLDIAKITADGDDGSNKAPNVLDNNLSTRWSSNGKGSWISADLGGQKTICSVDIAWYKGFARTYSFTISVSGDGNNFQQVYSGKSSSDTLDPESYDFADTQGRHVRITVNGNNNNNWAGITELDIFGSGGTSAPQSTGSIDFANVDDGQVLSGTYVVEVAASDPSSISKIELYVGDSFVKTERFSPYEFRMVTTDYSDGVHVLRAEATEKSGDMIIRTVEVTIDNDPSEPPSSSLTIDFANVVSGQVLSGSYEVVVTASDPGIVSNIKLYVGSTLIKQENFDPYEFPTDTTQFSDGSHVLKAVATDGSGDTIIETIGVTIQNQQAPPGGENPPPTSGTVKIMRPLWLPYADIDGQTQAYTDVVQDYDWPRLRMAHSDDSVPADDLAAFKSLKGNKLLSVTTLEKVKSQTSWAKSQGFAGVEYNIEGGFDAGNTEAQIKEAAKVVHDAGLKFVSTPTKAILADNWETIADVADMVHIQAQTLQDSPGEFDKFVGDWVKKLKARNPDLMITVQTGTGQPSAPGMTLLETFQTVTDLVITGPDAVDGVSVWFGSGEEQLMEQYFKWYHEKYRTGSSSPPSTPPPSSSLTIDFANVVSGQVLSGSYEVVVTASDPGIVSNIKLYVGSTLIKQENFDPYEFPTDTTQFSDGSHVLKAVATDGSGDSIEKTVQVTFNNDSPSPAPGPSPGPSPAGDLPTAQQVFQTEQFAAPSSVGTFVLYMANEFHEGPGQHKMLSPTNEFIVPKHLTIHSGTQISFHMADARWGSPFTYKMEIKDKSTGKIVHTTETIVYPDMVGSANSNPITLAPGTYTIDYQSIKGGEKNPHLNGEQHTITVLNSVKDAGANLIVGGFYATTSKASDMKNGDGDPKLGHLAYYQSNFPSEGLTIDSYHSFVWYSCTEEGGNYSDQCVKRPGENGESWADNKTGHHTLIIWKSTNPLTQVWDSLDELTTENVYI